MALKTYIPTRGHPLRQLTLCTLNDAGFEPTLVLSKGDPATSEYMRLGFCKKLRVKAANIHEKRQANLKDSKGKPFVMMDDDLTLFARNEKGTFHKASRLDVMKMYVDIESNLSNYAHVGISDKFMAQTRPRGHVEHGRYNQVLAYNPKLFPKPWPTFRMITNQEHDFHLQLATRGCPPCILTEYSKDAKYYADGGCAHYRTPALERNVFRQMAREWPGLVKVVATDKRPGLRMTVKWKKAVEIGEGRTK